MSTHLLNYIISILDSQNIQCTFLQAPYDNLQQIDYNLRSNLGLQDTYHELLDWILHDCQPNTIYMLRDTFFLSYVALKMPEHYQRVGKYAILGPLLYQPLSPDDFELLSEMYQLTSKMQKQFFSFYEQVPIYPNEDRFKAFIISLLEGILGSNVYMKHIDLTQSEMPVSLSAKVNLSQEVEPDLSLIQQRYQAENMMLDAIACGNYPKAILYHKKFMQYTIKPRNSNTLRNHQNYLIIFNTLLRKTVEKEHIHPYYIDELSHKLALKIESCTHTEQLNLLASEMLHKYCILVQNHSLQQYSCTVRKCITYIEFHYTEDLTLDIITHQLNLSKSYLSNLFKKELGITITDFIYKTKLRHALELLNSSTMSIHEIAIECGFSDINYFSRVFKKYQGITPTSYRKMLHGIDL